MTELWHRRTRDWVAFDHIELKVVPRYKTSGLSGDEWRTSVVLRFYFKGLQVHERSFSTMDAALLMLGREWIEQQEPISTAVIDREDKLCDQPSCCNKWVAKYRLKRLTDTNGHWLDMKDQYGAYYRKFCAVHLRRGDCSREDSDGNYVVIDGPGPGASTNVQSSPSGLVVLNDDCPEDF